MDNYFIENLETGKLELHFEKSTYTALSDEQKSAIKGAFLWGRHSGCWISRRKRPNLYYPREIAKSIGLEDAGKTGEKMSFAEQMQQKAERADRRADRYENYADNAAARGETLQKPIRDMHGDIAFFTQPNINTNAGRSFTNRRNKMFAAFDKGFEEFRKSAYWKDRAAAARTTAGQAELKDRAFVSRRIAERERDIRALKRGIESNEKMLQEMNAGKTFSNYAGEPYTAEKIQEWLNDQLDLMEDKLDELGFYQGCLEALGGTQFSKANIKPGYTVKVQRFGAAVVVSTGPKNITARLSTGNVLKFAYAEILQVISDKVQETPQHPFKIGDTFSCHRWNPESSSYESVTYTIIKSSASTVTMQHGSEKPFIRKPCRRAWAAANEWYLRITDSFDGIWCKRSA